MGLGPGPGRDAPPLGGTAAAATPGVKKGRDELGVEDALPSGTAPPTETNLNPHQARKQRHTIWSGIEKLFEAIPRSTVHFAFSSSIAKQERNDGEQDENGCDGPTCDSTYIPVCSFSISIRSVRWGAGSLRCRLGGRSLACGMCCGSGRRGRGRRGRLRRGSCCRRRRRIIGHGKIIKPDGSLCWI